MMFRPAMWLALTVSAACGGAPPPVATPAPALGVSAGFPIVAMHVTPMGGASGAPAHADLELRSDGTLVFHGDAAGRINGAQVVDEGGREVATVGGDGAVAIRRNRRRVQILEGGALLVDGAQRLYIDEQGRIVESRPGRLPRWTNMRLEGSTPETLRTAALVVLVAMIRTHQL